MVVIRTAKPEHRKSLHGLFLGLSRYADLWLVYSEMAAIDYALSNRQIKIALKGTTVIGAMVLEPRKEGVYIAAFYIKAGYRNKGIGKRLINEAIRRTKRQKKRYITVDTAFEYGAKGFYESCGFYRTKTHRDCWSLKYKC